MKETYELGKEALTTIEECHGNLIVRGWSEPHAQLRGEDFTVAESDKGITVHSNSALTIKVPEGSQVIIRRAHSDAIVKGITNHVIVEEVTGDLILKAVGAADVQRVHADMVAKQVNGPLQISEVTGDLVVRGADSVAVSRVHGDLAARQVEQNLTAEEVTGDVALRGIKGFVSLPHLHGDLAVSTVGGVLNAPQVTGSIRLTGPVGPGKHNLHAGSNIVVNWPGDLPVSIVAQAAKITNRLALDEEVSAEGTLNGRLGQSEPDITLVLEAGNRIVLKEKDIVNKSWVHAEIGEGGFNFDFDFAGLENLGEQLRSNFETQFAQLEKQFGADFAARMERKMERVVSRAENAADRARKQAERTTRRQTRRAAGRAPSGTRTATAEAPRKASTEEQMRVLKMLENGVISAAEAQTLLDALE